MVENITNLFYCYKQIGNNYDKQEIRKYLRKDNLIDFDLGYQLYLVLNDTSYLKTAYKQVQEKADNLEPDIKAKFLSYPIPSAIVEEWRILQIDSSG